jgi:hypothetical protein
VAVNGGFEPSVGDVGFEDRDWIENPTILRGISATREIIAITATTWSAMIPSPSTVRPSWMVLQLQAAIQIVFMLIRGDGMVNTNSTSTLVNVTLSGNTSLFHSGGIANFDSSPTLLNVTFSGDISQYGRGRAIIEQISSPILTDCILWGDYPDEI